ncbi:MAG: hypothetical protein EOP50_02780 [Sphingobacteriales bacterium]|nr:MAG: hypothetical protein EOP50_02780 [Sphingobacteriales bacterium]
MLRLKGMPMGESIAHFAVKSIGMSRVNGRKPCTLLEAARHNLREIQAEQGAKGHIDPKRTQHNCIIAGPASALQVQELANSLLADLDTSKLKRDHCQAIEAVFSLPSGSPIDPANYFAQCSDWLARETMLSVLSAVVHHDEAAAHLHVLLLPVKEGRHVGSAPIARPELKRLRDSYFALVAGPAGLKRDSAKLRGIVKQWAVAAVLRECEAMGLRNANGPLWPVLVVAIGRDPTAAMLALQIDVNSIRPAASPATPQLHSKAIGLADNPIGHESRGEEMQALSCVGLHQRNTTNETSEATKTHPDRLSVAQDAKQSAIARHTPRPSPRPATPAVRVGDDGTVRVRDEYAHDLSSWD